MKTVLITALLFASSARAADSVNLIEQMKQTACREQVKAKIGEKLRRQAWMPIAISQPRKPLAYGVTFRDTASQKAYRVWSNKSLTNFAEMDLKNRQQKISTFDYKNDCKEVVATEPMKSYPPVAKGGFDDAALRQTMAKNPWGVIYVWTPYMPLSVEAIKNIKEAVKAKGGDVKVVMDPWADPAEAKKWAAKKMISAEDMTPATSDELIAREMRLHYPITYIYKDGFVSNRDYVGWKSAPTYAQWIDTELAQLSKDMK